ncbi:MAG: hypothetical protein HIU82_15960 [Proteobacteria bacterium]|nr:hypothetical protein [Pseudomonadota bacterium]
MNRLSLFGLSATLAAVVALAPPGARSAAASAAHPSAITAIAIAGTLDVGTFHGIPFVRTWGTVSGVVAPDEKIHGLGRLPKDPDGDYAYTSPFEIIAPARHGANATILIESENRGSPIMLDNLDAIRAAGPPARAVYPFGLGDGFLEDSGLSYGRVAWQTGISPGVPATAQGVGEVIMRDFARMLAGDRSGLSAGAPDLGRYRTLLFGGISQSSWFVNTFIAEGFNADPVTGKRVFAGALAIDGTGNWLALNRLAAAHHAAEAPYFAPDALPLPARRLLSRPGSDPFYVDVANVTDFYRVHASLTDTTSLPRRLRRYDWPSPHHPVTTAADAAATFAATRPGGPCNDGTVVPLSPTSYTPFLRTLVIELAHEVGSPDTAHAPGLPPTRLFRLGPAPTGTAHFNPLHGIALKVPRIGKDAEPVGGVRFPAAAVPLGRPEPVSLPPVITTKITGVCGNIGQWQPFTTAEETRRYGSSNRFLRLYGKAADRQIATGYLLAAQKPGMLATAASQYANPDRP